MVDEEGMVINSHREMVESLHCEVMTWICFIHYWPCVRGIHQSLVDSPHKGPVMPNNARSTANMVLTKNLDLFSSVWSFMVLNMLLLVEDDSKCLTKSHGAQELIWELVCERQVSGACIDNHIHRILWNVISSILWIPAFDTSLWRGDMETVSALLALREGNP